MPGVEKKGCLVDACNAPYLDGLDRYQWGKKDKIALLTLYCAACTALRSPSCKFEGRTRETTRAQSAGWTSSSVSHIKGASHYNCYFGI